MRLYILPAGSIRRSTHLVTKLYIGASSQIIKSKTDSSRGRRR